LLAAQPRVKAQGRLLKKRTTRDSMSEKQVIMESQRTLRLMRGAKQFFFMSAFFMKE
jgi:hypothetical protein